jgi:hypothetical protein
MFSFWVAISRYNQKTDTTAQLYCTLSMCVTPKTVSRQNQKTNTPPQLYCTLSSTCICRSKPFSRQNQKLTQHNSTTGKKVPPAHPKQVYSFLCPSSVFCTLIHMWRCRINCSYYSYVKKIEKRLIRICEFEFSKSNSGRRFFYPIPISP